MTCPTGSSQSGTCKATDVGTYTCTCTANSGYTFTDGTCSRTWKINKANINNPLITNISNKGIVTWSTVQYASKYQLSMDGSNWTDVGTGSTYDFDSRICAAKGVRTVYLRAIGDANHNNSAVDSKNVTTYRVTLNGDAGIASTQLNGESSAPGVSIAKIFIATRQVDIKADLKDDYVFKK